MITPQYEAKGDFNAESVRGTGKNSMPIFMVFRSIVSDGKISCYGGSRDVVNQQLRSQSTRLIRPGPSSSCSSDLLHSIFGFGSLCVVQADFELILGSRI